MYETLPLIRPDDFRYGNYPKYLVPLVRKGPDADSESLNARRSKEEVWVEMSRTTC